MLAEIVDANSEHSGVLFCADLIPGAAWVHLPVTMGYDRFPEMLIDEKRAILTELHGRQTRLFFTHDPNVAIADIDLQGGRFSAVNPQAELVGS